MKIGFIGCGNMASAIMGGIIKEKVFAPADIYGTDALPAAVEKAISQFGIQTALDNHRCSQRTVNHHYCTGKNAAVAF